ncbi:MAG: mandelate racemase/muconate lactonizing enzyme family protein [Propionibacteriaceae bacterium]|nr:mandelate racemase/muconate lactonizing enzyme family protein [Propionibacteriaceae bacterium]
MAAIGENSKPEYSARIVQARAYDYEWPRQAPVANGLHTYATSDVSVVEIRTDIGITGYGVGRPRVGEREMRREFLSRLIGADATMTEAIWESLWSPKMSGRRGNETRALSSIDIALWDIKAKMAGLPLYRLLGGYRQRIPIYIAGGYYGKGKGLKELQAEFAQYAALGARAVKMKVGAVPIPEDLKRIAAVRQVIGDDIELLIDANCAYRYFEAISLSKQAEEYRVYWFEEPVQPDDYEGFAKIAAATAIPIAAGENEYTKHGFRDLIKTQAVAVLNPDVRYLGGVTEFMKVAAMAQAHGLDICPHGEQQAHLHVLAAIPNARLLEYYPQQIDPMAGKCFLYTPALNADGSVTVPEVPGAGLDPDFDALAPYQL